MSEYSTGYELILNACESALQIVVSENEKPLCFEEWFAPQQATEILAGALHDIFQKLHIKANYFRRIGCFAGPGSFTGIRLVLASAGAIRRTSNAQLASLDYLQSLATSAVIRRQLLYPGKVFVLTHARRDMVHFQEFISYGPQIPAQIINEVALVSPREALESMAGSSCLVCGSGLTRNWKVFEPKVTGLGPEKAPEAILMPELVNPDLAALCLLGRHGDYFPEDVLPKYVRGCDAIENLEKSEDGKKAAQKAEDIMTKGLDE